MDTATEIKISSNGTLATELQKTGYSFRNFEFPGTSAALWTKLKSEWRYLGPDDYLQSERMFRFRRYGQLDLVPSGQGVSIRPPQPYEQSQEINRYAGGVARVFTPLRPGMLTNPLFERLARFTFGVFDVEPEYWNATWTVEVHMFRIVAEEGDGAPPTPEGIHRDGFPFGAVIMMGRENVRGGETQIFTPSEELIEAHTMTSEGEALFAFDARIKHYVTPVSTYGGTGHRDILIFGYHLPDTKYAKG
ncbi:MAG: hypothetical protein RL685_67 [Pseudomonadota bacterium]|jgi:hypothetical protein